MTFIDAPESEIEKENSQAANSAIEKDQEKDSAEKEAKEKEAAETEKLVYASKHDRNKDNWACER